MRLYFRNSSLFCPSYHHGENQASPPTPQKNIYILSGSCLEAISKQLKVLQYLYESYFKKKKKHTLQLSQLSLAYERIFGLKDSTEPQDNINNNNNNNKAVGVRGQPAWPCTTARGRQRISINIAIPACATRGDQRVV